MVLLSECSLMVSQIVFVVPYLEEYTTAIVFCVMVYCVFCFSVSLVREMLFSMFFGVVRFCVPAGLL